MAAKRIKKSNKTKKFVKKTVTPTKTSTYRSALGDYQKAYFPTLEDAIVFVSDLKSNEASIIRVHGISTGASDDQFAESWAAASDNFQFPSFYKKGQNIVDLKRRARSRIQNIDEVEVHYRPF